MGLVSKTLPGFYNGISQQAPSMRLETQGELQENALGSLVDGLIKRPNTEFVSTLSATNVSEGSLLHKINRDATERYMVVFTGDATEPIEVYTLAGVKCTVQYGYLDEDLTYTASTAPKAYLATTGTPLEALKAMSVADYTFILNKEKTVAVDTTEALETKDNVSYVWVRDYIADSTLKDRRLGLYDSAGTLSLSIVEGHQGTQNAATSLSATIDALPAFTSATVNSVFSFAATAGTPASLTVGDDHGDTTMVAIVNHKIADVTDLPPYMFGGVRVVIDGDDDSYYNDYYMEFEAAGVNGEGAGAWVESRGWSQYNKILPSTMPHRLVRTATNTFTFAPCVWNERLVGDDNTAPMPSFVGSTINNLFFWKNRLGFLSDDNFILSKAGEFFDLFPTTVMDILDDDPIDTAVSTTKVASLHSAATFNKNLILFGAQQQASVGSGDGILTPSSTAVSPTTAFETCPMCEPVEAGANVYFVNPKSDYSAIREYFVQADSLTDDAADITAHVPKFIPNGLIQIEACNSMDMLFVLSDADPSTLYVYKYYWVGTEKQQSAWSKWTFGGDILGMFEMAAALYLLIDWGDSVVTLEKMCLENTPTFNIAGALDLSPRIHLDRATLIEDTTGIIYGTPNRAYWHVPYTIRSTDTLEAVNPETGLPVEVSYYGDNTVTGDISLYHTPIVLGLPYTMRYRLSEWYLRNEKDGAILEGRLQIRFLTLAYTNTGYFKVSVMAEGRGEVLQELEWDVLADPPVPINGEKKFLIMAKAKNTVVEIINDSPLPCQIQSGAWEGTFSVRSKIL